MDYCMLSFISTHTAITAQRLLEGICPIQTMPVLREVSAGCGIAVRFPPECLSAARSALDAYSLSTDEYTLYSVTGSGKALTVEII